MRPVDYKNKMCKSCGEGFKPEQPSHLYCSAKCKESGRTNAYLRRVYGITLETYNHLYQQQDGKCAVCGGEGFLMKPEHKVRLVVDHCHETGEVRGLLCHNCNRALGLLQDSTESLERALEYLKVQRLSREGVRSSERKR